MNDLSIDGLMLVIFPSLGSSRRNKVSESLSIFHSSIRTSGAGNRQDDPTNFLPTSPSIWTYARSFLDRNTDFMYSSLQPHDLANTVQRQLQLAHAYQSSFLQSHLAFEFFILQIDSTFEESLGTRIDSIKPLRIFQKQAQRSIQFPPSVFTTVYQFSSRSSYCCSESCKHIFTPRPKAFRYNLTPSSLSQL